MKIPKVSYPYSPSLLSHWIFLGSSNMLKTLLPSGLLTSCSIFLEYYLLCFTRLIPTHILDNCLAFTSSTDHIVSPRPSLMAFYVLLWPSTFTMKSTHVLSATSGLKATWRQNPLGLAHSKCDSLDKAIEQLFQSTGFGKKEKDLSHGHCHNAYLWVLPPPRPET